MKDKIVVVMLAILTLLSGLVSGMNGKNFVPTTCTLNTVSVHSIPAGVSPEGLVGYWNFDEGSGSIAHDSSGNGNDGTIYGATWTPGKFGYALGFDGIDDFVKVTSPPNLPAGNSARTITAWVNVKVLPKGVNEGVVVGYGTTSGDSSFELGVFGENKDNRFFYSQWYRDVVGNTIPQVGQWYHIAITHDGTTQRLYVNGVVESTGSLTPNTPSGTDLLIGKFYQTDISRQFNGLIDEVGIWNRALSAEEIKQLATVTSGYTPHTPISINGNNEFTPANGVTGGSGTQTDPYIIEGWEIDAQGGKYGIQIENTDAYFVLKNSYVFNATLNTGMWWDQTSAIRLVNVVNGKIYNNTVVHSKQGIALLDGSNHNQVSYNVINDTECGIFMYPDSTYNIITNNVFTNVGSGLYLECRANYNFIANNTIYNASTGIYLGGYGYTACKYNNITGNKIQNCNGVGISISSFEPGYNVIYNNEITNISSGNLPGYGIYFFDATTHNLVMNNRIARTASYGIYLKDSSSSNEIYLNSFINTSPGGKGANGTSQAYDGVGGNYWYNNTTKKGNYWSNWDGNNWGTPDAYPIDGGAGAYDMYPLSQPVWVLQSPSAPQNLVASVGNQQVSLSWQPPADDGGSPITGYKIYYGTSPGNYTKNITVGNITNYTITGLAKGQKYYFAVSAINGVGEGPKSIEVSITTPCTVPSEPQNLTATGDYHMVCLEWDQPADSGGLPITNYTIYFRRDPRNYTTKLIIGNSTNYTIGGLTSGKQYYFAVSATNAIGEGPRSREVSAQPTSGQSAIYEKYLDWDLFRDIYNFSNFGSIWSPGGNCYGISATEILYWQHYIKGNNSMPYLPSAYFQPHYTYDLQIPPFQEFILPNGSKKLGLTTQNNTSLAITMHQLYDPDNFGLGDKINKSDIRLEYEKVNASISNNTPIIIVLGWNDLHAVVVWGVKVYQFGQSNKTAVLYISDPNFYISEPNFLWGISCAYYYINDNTFEYEPGYVVGDSGNEHLAEWHDFIAISPGIMKRDWFFHWWWPPDWFAHWKNISIEKYTLIVGDKDLHIWDKDGRCDYFTTMGNSQTLHYGIPGSAGITEGDIVAFAVPKGTEVNIDPPINKDSFVYLFTVENGNTGYAYLLRTSSESPYNYNITFENIRDGLRFNPVNSTVKIDLTVFHMDAENHYYIFNATNLTIKSGDIAEIKVQNWSLLNSTDTASVKLLLYKSGSDQPYKSYDLQNGCDGIKDTTQPQPTPGFEYIEIMAVIAIAVLVGYRRRKVN